MFRILGISFICVGVAIAMGFGLAASAGLSDAGAGLRNALAADRVAGVKDRYIIVTPPDQLVDPVGVPTVPVALLPETPEMFVPEVIEAPRPPTSRLKATAVQSPALAPAPAYRSVAVRRAPVAASPAPVHRQVAPVVERVSRVDAPQRAVPGYMIGVYR